MATNPMQRKARNSFLLGMLITSSNSRSNNSITIYTIKTKN